MSRTGHLSVFAAALLCAATAVAKAPASAPAGTTAMCKDGSYSSAATKSGACSGHDGVKKWYGATTATSAVHEGDSSAKSAKRKAAEKSAPTDTAAPATPVGPATPAAPAIPPTRATPATRAGAATPAAAAATGVCKDGSTTSAGSKSGACSGHGGVKEWYAAATPAAASAPAKVANPPSSVAPGGGRGQVWANKDTKVYHCPGDKWYGKTREGAYMTEASARAQGYHADHGKACQP